MNTLKLGELVTNQLGKQSLHYQGHIYHQFGTPKIHWINWACHNRRKLNCKATIKTEHDQITISDDSRARHFPCLPDYDQCNVFKHKAELRKAAQENSFAKSGQILAEQLVKLPVKSQPFAANSSSQKRLIKR